MIHSQSEVAVYIYTESEQCTVSFEISHDEHREIREMTRSRSAMLPKFDFHFSTSTIKYGEEGRRKDEQGPNKEH